MSGMNNEAAATPFIFDFEPQAERSLTFIPLSVRMKLDVAGLKSLARTVGHVAVGCSARGSMRTMPYVFGNQQISRDSQVRGSRTLW